MKSIIGAGMLLVFATSRAEACPACFMSASDRILPPIYAWCLLSFVWFLGAAIVAERRAARFSGVPRVSVAIIVIIFAALLGMGTIGPFPLLLLMATPITAFIRSIALRNQPGRTAADADMAVVGSILMAVTLGLAGWSLYLRQTRTEAQFIVQWPGGAPALAAPRRLQEREPASLPEYRYLVQHGSGNAAKVATERIEILEGRKKSP
jgi:hypothetical protein